MLSIYLYFSRTLNIRTNLLGKISVVEPVFSGVPGPQTDVFLSFLLKIVVYPEVVIKSCIKTELSLLCDIDVYSGS